MEKKRKLRPRFRDTEEMLVFIRAMIKRSELAIRELDRKIEEEERAFEELKRRWAD